MIGMVILTQRPADQGRCRLDPARFERLARYAARRPSRRAVLGALGSAPLGALGGGAAAARGTVCLRARDCGAGRECFFGRCRPIPSGGSDCDQKRCCGNGRVVCFGRYADRRYQRFVLCVSDKGFWERPASSCREFCAKWAGPSCTCC